MQIPFGDRKKSQACSSRLPIHLPTPTATIPANQPAVEYKTAKIVTEVTENNWKHLPSRNSTIILFLFAQHVNYKAVEVYGGPRVGSWLCSCYDPRLLTIGWLMAGTPFSSSELICKKHIKPQAGCEPRVIIDFIDTRLREVAAISSPLTLRDVVGARCTCCPALGGCLDY